MYIYDTGGGDDWLISISEASDALVNFDYALDRTKLKGAHLVSGAELRIQHIGIYLYNTRGLR